MTVFLIFSERAFEITKNRAKPGFFDMLRREILNAGLNFFLGFTGKAQIASPRNWL